MLARVDTLVTRIVVIVAIAVVTMLVLLQQLLELEKATQYKELPGPLGVVAQAYEALAAENWPADLTDSNLSGLRLTSYSITRDPITPPSQRGPVDMLRLRLNLSEDIPIGFQPVGANRRKLSAAAPDRPSISVGAWPSSDAGQTPVGWSSRSEMFDNEQIARVSIELGEKRWVNLETKPTGIKPKGLGWFAIILIVCLMMGIGGWAAVNAVRPLRRMAKAADRLAANYTHDPLPENGPSDVQKALKAFNRMGRRLESTVTSQRQLLAALGHDLRTPITSLRLKAEMLSNETEKARMIRALSELERITEAALSAASAGQSDEPFQKIDIHSLLGSLIDDLQSLGMAVTMGDSPTRPVIAGRPGELTRAFRNLIENGVLYGDSVCVSLHDKGRTIEIHVRDQGPGIEEKDMDRVFEPLVRLEPSRNKATGGHGLGLHIAKSLIEAHDGDVSLHNHADGGLLVIVSLPNTAAE